MVVEATVNEVNTESAQEQAARIIASSVKWGAAASIVPVPYLDLVGLGAVQYSMIRDIARAYDQEPQSEMVRGLVSTLLGTLTPFAASGALVGSSLKFIPGGGSLLGSVSLAAFGSAATYAIGKTFVRHFEGGGTMDNFSADAIKEDLKKDFSKAKKESA